jgi:hypothetical protein
MACFSFAMANRKGYNGSGVLATVFALKSITGFSEDLAAHPHKTKVI